MSHCIFCEIAAGRAPASLVTRDDRVCTFLDIQPVNPGHLLVVPIDHVPDLAHLERAAASIRAAIEDVAPPSA